MFYLGFDLIQSSWALLILIRVLIHVDKNKLKFIRGGKCLSYSSTTWLNISLLSFYISVTSQEAAAPPGYATSILHEDEDADCSATLRCFGGIAANSAFTAGGGLTFKSDRHTMNECGEVLDKVFLLLLPSLVTACCFFSLFHCSLFVRPCPSSLFFFVPHLKLLERKSLKAVEGVNISGSESGKKNLSESVNQDWASTLR